MSWCLLWAISIGGVSAQTGAGAELGVVVEGSQRRWQVYDASNGALINQGADSGEGGVLSLARWRNVSIVPELLAIRQQSNGQVRAELLTAGVQTSVTLSEGFFTIAGGDFDGSGESDVVVIQAKGERRVWQVHLNPLGDASKKRFNWGAAGDVPFYVEWESGRDWLGLLRRARAGVYRRVVLRDVVSGQRVTVKLARAQRGVLKVRPLIYIDQPAIALFKKGRYVILDLNGAVLFQGSAKFGGSSTDVTIGDYLNLPGDELAVRSEGSEVEILSIPSGISRFVELREGSLVGRFAMGRFSSAPQSDLLSCSTVLNPADGPGGFLWKESEFGGLVVLTDQGFDDVVILKGGKIIDGPLEYSGIGNGNRHHWRNRGRSATDYPDGIVFMGRRGNTRTCWQINPQSRID